MELYLQFGYGMMEHCRHLVESWSGSTVILSPRDLTGEQIARLGACIVERGGSTLVDPQLYDPRATHHRLLTHDYWPSDFETSMLMGGSSLATLLQRLRCLNDEARADRFIVPGIYGARVDDDWLAIQDGIVDEAVRLVRDVPLIATVCLSGEAIRYEDQVEIVLNAAERWDVDGVYVVPEHPSGQYLVDDPMWLGNLLILCSGFAVQGKQVFVGYCSHQMLCLAVARVNAIASGTWLNVRSFPPDKFNETEPDDISRRAKWYYCPQALSEYKVPFLDMAYRFGKLSLLQPDEACRSNYADVLFSGAQPTSTDYSEQQSHRHYLQCLRMQCASVSRESYREALEAQNSLLQEAELVIQQLHRYGVRGQDRDFREIVDVNRSALAALDHTRGFVLDRVW